MDLPGKRIRKWREHLGLNGKQFEAATGIPYSTLKTLENNEDPERVKPSFDVLAKILHAYGQLNPDWLLLGTGSMLRDGRALTPMPAHFEEARPAVGLSVSQPTREEWAAVVEENRQLREQLAAKDGKLSAVEEERVWLRTELIKKPEASADAASLYNTVDEIAREYQYTAQVEVPEIARFVPKRREVPVRNPVGFSLSVA